MKYILENTDFYIQVAPTADTSGTAILAKLVILDMLNKFNEIAKEVYGCVFPRKNLIG